MTVLCWYLDQVLSCVNINRKSLSEVTAIIQCVLLANTGLQPSPKSVLTLKGQPE